MINFLAGAGITIVVLPILVYISAKLGGYGWERGRHLAEQDKLKGQL